MPSARCVVLEAFGQPVTTKELEVAPPQPGALVATIDYGGVRGTDVHLQQGRLPIPLPLVPSRWSQPSGLPARPH
jgi:Zn-dependent alcohol dehydrogenase